MSGDHNPVLHWNRGYVAVSFAGFGAIPLPATVRGGLAVHPLYQISGGSVYRSRSRWVVTHIGTGLRALGIEMSRKQEAFQAAEMLLLLATWTPARIPSGGVEEQAARTVLEKLVAGEF